jgi:hypothetical protein
LNGVVIGIMMIRFGRADRRSNQIVFSRNACIMCIRGRFYFTFQCFDLQASKPIIGATIRIFAILHEVDKEAKALWQMRAMRLVRPDDELGGKVWLSVPCIAVHEIDAWSPIAPSALTRPPKVSYAAPINRFPQPPQRSTEGRTGSRAQSVCYVCGQSYNTEAALRRHILYAQLEERSKNRGEDFGHMRINIKNVTRPVVLRAGPNEKSNESSMGSEAAGGIAEKNSIDPPGEYYVNTTTPEAVRDAIRDRITSRNIEIVCLIEGTDPFTSNTFQARHSYAPTDIEYDAQHSPCMGVGQDGGAEVNLSYFHQVERFEHCNIEDPVPFASHI